MEKSNKLIMVVGGSGGIGSEIARSFLLAGNRVCVTYYQNKQKTEELLSQFNDSCFAYQMNLRDEQQVGEIFKQAIEEHGSFDTIVFAPTGAVRPGQLTQKKWEDFDEHLTVQVKGLFLLAQHAILKKKQTSKLKFVVVVTECCIGTPPSSLSDYITAKYALLGLAKSLAVEAVKYNCTVNMISPGMVDTNLLKNLPPKLLEMVALKNPLKRLATPQDVASVALFLASDEAGYLNGVNIVVNGGNVMV